MNTSFWCCLSLLHDLFRLILLQTTHFLLPVISCFKNGSFSLRFFSKSQLLMRCVKCFSFSSWGTEYRVFEHSQVVLNGFQCMYVIHEASLQSHELYCDDPNRLLLWLGHHQLQLDDQIVFRLWVKNHQNEICQTNFDCRSFKASFF